MVMMKIKIYYDLFFLAGVRILTDERMGKFKSVSKVTFVSFYVIIIIFSVSFSGCENTRIK